MARPRTNSPKIYLHRSSGWYCVNLSGQRKRLGRTMAEAQEAYPRVVGEWLVGGRQSPPAQRQYSVSTASVADVLLSYWKHVQASPGDGKQKARVKEAIRAASRLYGPRLVESFDQLALQAVRADLLGRPDRRARGLPAQLWDVLQAGPVRPQALVAAFPRVKKAALQFARRQLGVQVVDIDGQPHYRLPEGSQRPQERLLARRYVNSLIACLQRAWTWLEGQKQVPAGSAAALATVRPLTRQEGGRETAPVLPVEPEVVEQTLAQAGPVLAAMVRISQLTGCRPDEVCQMRGRDISRAPTERIRIDLPDGKWLHVSAMDLGEQGLVWVYVPTSHKTLWRSKPKIIVLGPQAQAVLAPFLEGRDPEAYLFSPREASDQARRQKGQKCRYGKGRQPGARWTAESYARAVKRAARNAGVPEWTPGRLRHSMAGELVEAADHDTAAAFLGHASPTMTAHYALQAIRKAAALAAKLG